MWMKQGFPTICAPNYHESALPKPQIIKSGIFARWMFKGKKVTIIVPFPLGWTKIATNWFKLTDNWPKWSRMAQNRRGSCGKWPNLAETAWYPSAPPQLPAAVIQKIGVLQNCLQNLQHYNFFLQNSDKYHKRRNMLLHYNYKCALLSCMENEKTRLHF